MKAVKLARTAGAIKIAGAAGALTLLVAACSSGGGGGGGGNAAAAGPSSSASAGGQTVAVRSASGISDVLTDAKGRTLYVSDKETGGKVLCTHSDCLAIWTPLTVPAGQNPTGPASVMGKLTTVMRPDGKTQVTLDGKPLYTFTFDHGAGDVNGNGTKDSFDGTDFTWQVATASGAAPSAPSTTDNGGYGGGYNY